MVRTSAEFRRKMLQRAKDIRSEADAEYRLVLDHLEGRLPDLADHPAFRGLIETWWEPIALDMPPEWAVALPMRCMEFFSNSDWTLPQFGDGVRRNISVERCQKLLGKDGGSAGDKQIIFLREQLYSLAEVVLDRLSGESKETGS